MAVTQQIVVRDEGVRRALEKIGNKPDALQPTFRRFAQYMRVQTDNTFEALRLGGRFRGVLWKYFAPQYTRKTDGVTVPAWGGVPKVRGSGLVKGRKRPSGARVRQGDAIMQDTETMRGMAALVVRMDRYMARLGVQGVNYAAAQHKRRPFLFFVQADADELVGMLRLYLTR